MEKCTTTVSTCAEIAETIYDLQLQLPETSRWEVRPGQFVGLYPGSAARLLMRPISICTAIKPDRLRLVFRAGGPGTKELAGLRPGETVDVLGPLGNGYDVEMLAGGRVLLLGGGIGIPPMLGLARSLTAADAEVTAVLGYRNGELFLKDDFERAAAHVLIACEDGSTGVRGNVLDALRVAQEETAHEVPADAICACGPLPMLRAVRRYAAERKLPCFISLEERMACGVGACLGCVVRTRAVDGHSHVRNARICTEGPVFAAEDVEI